MGSASSTTNKLCSGDIPACDPWTDFYTNPLKIQKLKRRAKKDVKWFSKQLSNDKYIPLNALVVREVIGQLHLDEWDDQLDGPNLLAKCIDKKVGPRNLFIMVEQISACIVTHHPVLCRVLGKLRASNYIFTDIVIPMETFTGTKWEKGSTVPWTFQEFVKYTLHTMFVFECIVKIGMDEVAYQDRIINYYNRLKRHHFTSSYDLWMRTNTFSLMKSESVQMQYPIWAKIRKMSRKAQSPNITVQESQRYHAQLEKLSDDTRFGLSLNILEAVAADKLFYKIPDNAKAGMALILNPVGKVTASPIRDKGKMYSDNSRVKFLMPGSWADLYVSWNLNFVSKFSNPHQVFAKLLQPSVFCAQPDDFIYPRALSLLVTVQSFMLDMLTHRSIPNKIPGMDFIMKHAKINGKFGDKMAVKVSDSTVNSWRAELVKVKNIPRFAYKTLKILWQKPLKMTKGKKPFSQDTIGL